MRKLAEVCIKRPVFATMIVMALVVVGAASYFRLGVDRFPAVDLPTVTVRVELPGASTEEIETQLTQKVEEQINTIQGIQELRSISTPGNALVIITFVLSRNIDVAAQDVRDKVSIAQRNLPRDAKAPIISKFDNDQAPVLTIALASDRSLRELNLHLVLGSILASLVVLAFMRSWRSTFIAAVAIPTSVISAFGMMWMLNFTLNSVTMLALVLMVGIVIDDAIVVLENVFRFVEEKKMKPFDAARLLRAEDAGGHSESHGAASRRGFYRYIDAGYSACLAWSMRHRWVIVVVS